MKRHTLNLLMLLAATVLLAYPSLGDADQAPDPQEPAKGAEENQADAPDAYTGQLPDNDKLEVLSEHKVIATFREVKYRRCMGRTGMCPDRCGNSGNFANFEITDYLHYKKEGKYGDEKQKTYTIQISDFHREPKGDPALLAYAETLEGGDLVIIEWKHLYGEVEPGVKSPVRPLLLLKKIDKGEAKRLIEEARAEQGDEQEQE
jgi:hypothetical protein